jgi:hypothetical protein
MYLDQQFFPPLSQKNLPEENSDKFASVNSVVTPKNILQLEKAEMTTYPYSPGFRPCAFRKMSKFIFYAVLIFLIYLVIVKGA